MPCRDAVRERDIELYRNTVCNDITRCVQVCNFRCKDLSCQGCQDGNCKCVKVKAKGEHCGDGTRRGPEFSNMECQTGKCAYNCDLCLNCDGGNCVCVVDESVHGT